MWDYIMVLLAVVLLAIGFIVQKIYQKGSKSSNESSIMFSIISAVCSIVVLILLNGFSFDITWYSAINAGLRALCAFCIRFSASRLCARARLPFICFSS